MEQALRFAPSERKGRQVWTVEGELDMATASLLERHVSEAVASGATDLLLDMSAVTFIDSSGLRALIAAKKLVPGRMVVLAPSRAVRRLFEVSGLSSAIEVFDAIEDVDHD